MEPSAAHEEEDQPPDQSLSPVGLNLVQSALEGWLSAEIRRNMILGIFHIEVLFPTNECDGFTHPALPQDINRRLWKTLANYGDC
jgi:hypothetical protein